MINRTFVFGWLIFNYFPFFYFEVTKFLGMHLFLRVGISILLVFASITTSAQCTWYTVSLDVGDTDFEVTWELIDSNGVTWISGGAPFEEDICLPNGCYTLLMYDSGGDGWEDEDWVIEDWTGDFDFDTNLDDGFHGFDILDLGETGCSTTGGGGGSDPCLAGTEAYTLTVSSGADPNDISWYMTLNGSTIAGGGAPATNAMCLADGCYFFYMFDDEADAWEGANYSLADEAGTVLYTGTLTELVTDTVLFNIGGLDCSSVNPDINTGEGCGQEAPSSDCSTAACICDPYTFQLTASGSGFVNEIPSPGSISNPSYGPINAAPWGGTDYGCLLAGELNSHWMMFTVANDGLLEFAIGAGGQQVGFYDWEMWAYDGVSTCTSIANNSLGPVRCIWNAASTGGTGISNVLPSGGNAGNYGPGLAVTAGQQFILCISNWSFVNAMVTINFTGSAQIECSLLLPLEILDFSGNQHMHHADLYWRTTNETNVSEFEIQHSTDGILWQVIGHVAADLSNSIEHNYTFEHSHPANGNNYYRLKEVDMNGASTYSEKRLVEFNIDSGFNIYPNPAISEIQLVVSEEILNGYLEVFDAQGRQIERIDLASMQLLVDISNWSNGVYLFRLANSANQTYRLIVEN